jgi:prevent-host-death family protein
MSSHTRTIGAGELRAKCMEVLEEAGDGEELLVIKRGHPVARLAPLDSDEDGDWPFPDLSHMYKFIGDVVSPIDIEWEAMKDD